MSHMRFIVAPEWFMKLPNTDVLPSKAVLEIYQYAQHNCGSQVSHLVTRKRIPPPDVVIIRPKRNKIGWSVGYLKKYLKLPTELIELELKNKEKT